MTARSLLLQWARRFREAGIPDPETDAALLLASVTGGRPLELRMSFDELPAEKQESFEGLARRRLTREPLQYILGTAPFCGRDFRVDERVLIPRPETEELVRMAAGRLKQAEGPLAALDLCCGSGCIGISLKLAVPEATVDCSDVSTGALALGGENAAALGADVRFLQGNLWEAVPDRQYDVIVTNPPYIPTAECAVLQEEVLREPVLALDGGEDGLDIFRRIAEGAPEHLKPGGRLLCEIATGEGKAAAALLQANGFSEVCVLDDLNGLERYVTGKLPE